MNLKRNGLLLALCYWCFQTLVFSQTVLEKRAEIGNNFDIYKNVIPFGKEGVLFIQSDVKPTKGRRAITFIKYNADLEMLKKDQIFLENKLVLDESYQTETHFFYLYTNKKREYTLLSIRFADLKIDRFDGQLVPKSGVKEMVVLSNKAYISGFVGNDPYFFSIDLNSGKNELIPLKFDEGDWSISWGKMQIAEKTNEALIYVERKQRFLTDFEIYRIDANGKLLTTLDIPGDKEHPILELKILPVEQGKYIFTGTYGNGKSRLEPVGIVLGMITDGEIQYTKYFNYLDFDNFLSFLSDVDRTRLEPKKERRDKKGKEMEVKYCIVPHEILKRDNKYIYIGEIYSPTYHYESVAGNNGHDHYQVFDGNKYTHFIVACFDEKGEMLWNRTAELKPKEKPEYAKKFISVSEDNYLGINMAFVNKNTITTLSLDFDGNTLKEVVTEILETEDPDDKTKFYSSYLNFWYDNYFLAHGSQKIKNKNRRLVYFFNKLKF